MANLPQYIRKQLTEKIADESSKAKENLQTSQLNFLTKIEWLKFYPLKKILLGVIWLVCLFYAVRGVFMTINDPRGVFIFLTVFILAYHYFLQHARYGDILNYLITAYLY